MAPRALFLVALLALGASLASAADMAVDASPLPGNPSMLTGTLTVDPSLNGSFYCPVTVLSGNNLGCFAQCTLSTCPNRACVWVSDPVTPSTFTCECPSAVCGDPHFQGARGIEFDFHGKPGSEYALISDQDFFMTAHMIGQSTAETGFEGTWMSALGFMYNHAGRAIQVQVALEEVDGTVTDKVIVAVNGQTIDMSSGWYASVDLDLSLSNKDGTLSVVLGDYVTAEVTVGEHKFPTGFHLDFALNRLKTSSFVHGVLGQTFSTDRSADLAALVAAAATEAGSKKTYKDSDVIEGAESDYKVSGLFQTDFTFNRFVAPGQGSVRKMLSFDKLTQVPYAIRSAANAFTIQG